MRYGSVCSGIEAATAAWHQLGWEPAFFSEIDAFPREVLAHHYPHVPCHGDFTTIGENDYGPIDLLVGGTPCQDFSVAGLRQGFAGARGNLTLEFLRLVKRKKPKIVVWENVPGILSVDGGRAFGAFLGGLAECGYGFAYRVLDASGFGVPLRRRRVIVIGYFGNWRRAAAILFERETISDMRGPFTGIPTIDASGLAKKQTMPERGRCWTIHDGIGHRFLTCVEIERIMGFPDGYTDLSQKGISATKTPAESISALQYDAGTICENAGVPKSQMQTMWQRNETPGCGSLSSNRESARDNLPPMQYKTSGYRGHGVGNAGLGLPRRGITPDGPRYKALGNSMAVPVMLWLGERIELVESL